MRYWVYMNGQVLERPFEKEELYSIDGFAGDTLICPEVVAEGAQQEWSEADVLLKQDDEQAAAQAVQQPAPVMQPQQTYYPYAQGYPQNVPPYQTANMPFIQQPVPQQTQYAQPMYQVPVQNAEQNPELEKNLLNKIDNLSKELHEVKQKLFSLSDKLYVQPEAVAVPQEVHTEKEQETPEEKKEPAPKEEDDVAAEQETQPSENTKTLSLPPGYIDDITPAQQNVPAEPEDLDAEAADASGEIKDMDSLLGGEETASQSEDFLQEAINTTFSNRNKKQNSENADAIVDLAKQTEEPAAAKEEPAPAHAAGDVAEDDIPTVEEEPDDKLAFTQADLNLAPKPGEEISEAQIPEEPMDGPGDEVTLTEKTLTEPAVAKHISNKEPEVTENIKQTETSPEPFSIEPENEEKDTTKTASMEEVFGLPEEQPAQEQQAEEQPLPSEEQPLPSEKQPLPSEEQPLPSEEQPLPAEEQPLTAEPVEEQPSAEYDQQAEQQPLQPEEQPFEQEPLPAEEQALPSEEQPLQPEEQVLQPLQPEDQAYDPNRDMNDIPQEVPSSRDVAGGVAPAQEEQPITEEDRMNIEETNSSQENEVLEEFAADKKQISDNTKNITSSAFDVVETDQKPSVAPMPAEGDDKFLKTFTSSIEEVFLDQPTSIISDYVPPAQTPEEEAEAQPEVLQQQQEQPKQGMASLMDLKSAPQEDQRDEGGLKKVRRIKPAAIKTIPMVAANGQDIKTGPQPNIDEAIAELGGNSILEKILKTFGTIAGLLVVLLLFIALLAAMHIIPISWSPAHMIIGKMFKKSVAEESGGSAVDASVQEALKDKEAKLAAAQEIISKVKNFKLQDGSTLEQKISATHSNQADQIEWTADQAVDPSYYSIAAKLPPNQEGYSLTYRFSYNTMDSTLVPTTSEANNIMQASPSAAPVPQASAAPAAPLATPSAASKDNGDMPPGMQMAAPKGGMRVVPISK